MTDTGAYFVGRAFGRHKMVPWLSPKKTWEGFAGGLLVTIICALAIGHWLHQAEIVQIQEPYVTYPWALALLGLLLGLVSAGGDLCASLLKRDAAGQRLRTGLAGARRRARCGRFTLAGGPCCVGVLGPACST